jgi:energy-coupling factor transport system substrate-specific component
MSTATKSKKTDAPAAKPKRSLRWRVVDIVVAAVIGVAAGLVFFAWNQVYNPLSAPFEAALPGLQSLVYGVWLIAAVLGGLIIRKPGAAIFVELVAATVSALLGAQWGLLTLESGLVQGLGAELVFLIFLYANWRLPVAILAGAASGLALAINDLILWYAGSAPAFAAIYTIGAIVSGAVIAGVGSWLIQRGLARTGALNRFASGRESTAAA